MSSNNKRKHQGAELEQELLGCAVSGNFDRTRELIEDSRVNVNCCSTEIGITPLMFAVHYNNDRVARYLIEKKATVDAVDNEGHTVLAYAMVFNNIEMFRLLLDSGANKDQQFQVQDGTHSPLGYAIVFSRNVAMVRLLLQFDANTVETLCFGQTYPALHLACRLKDINAEIVGLLLNHNDGVDMNEIVSVGGELTTPLCWACRDNNIQVARLFVEHGAQVSYDGAGHCPLACAVNYGSEALVRYLLGNLPEGDNSPALSKLLDTALRKNKLEAAQLLLQHGANINGQLYLYMCAEYWHGEEGIENVVSFLLEKGAHVNKTSEFSGETPLFAAAKRGNVELVKMFLKAGAHVSMTNNFGKTPLFAAAEGGSVEVVKILLKVQEKADVSIRTVWGETPLGAASRQGHVDVVYLLLRTSPQVWPRLANFV